MKVANLAAAIAVILACILGFLFMGARRDSDTARAEIAALRAAANPLNARIAELEATHVDAATLNRLQADQREAIKLRGEIGNLKKSLAVAESAAAAASRNAAAKSSQATGVAQVPPEQNPFVRVLNTKAAANLPVGHALALGGWESGPGKRAFAFVSPTTDPASPDQIIVQTKWVEVSNEVVASSNFAGFFPTEGQQAAMSAEQFQAFIKQLEQTAGADILSSPTIMTASGRPGRISVTEERQTPNGPAQFGPQMDLTPTQRPDGTIDLSIDATIAMAAPGSVPTAAPGQ